ncbi:hypothetical protein PCA20602_04413 [Pandoraea capi]|uniref:S-adenosylhomocysteine hydrolase n=2 Tax=Pandoraea capi TaxID=2508286 RepID=A0ABY6WAB0_9BURK|nr:DUF6088 family protein [Pandoraea capi]VVE45825.1 hypothetical protein PCA20602_04413 [Pandoraea capi]
MSLKDELAASIRKRRAIVFLRSDFASLGSEASLSRALRELIDAGAIVRLGFGVYAKAKRSVLSGRPIPVRPIEVLAPQVLKRLGVKTYPSRLITAYNEARSTQLPMDVVINTGPRRIARKLGFGKQFILYESSTEKSD